MILKCKTCGKEFQRDRKPKDLDKVYCSLECSHKARIKKIKCTCGYCGNELEKDPAEIKRSKSGLTFCNKSCACSYNNSTIRIGKNNPNWRGGQFSHSNYQTIAYRKYKHECAICHYDEISALEVHHIDNNHENNSLDNLIILCANHHNMIHYGTLTITEEIKQNREKLEI